MAAQPCSLRSARQYSDMFGVVGVATYLKVNRATVYRLMWHHGLQGFRIGDYWCSTSKPSSAGAYGMTRCPQRVHSHRDDHWPAHRARKPRGRICRSATKGTGEKMAQCCWLSPELVAQIELDEQKSIIFAMRSSLNSALTKIQRMCAGRPVPKLRE